MANIQDLDPETSRIQNLLGLYLTNQRAVEQNAGHLDDDALSAFVEGTLTEREAAPLVSHLAACGFCRHITADLVRLDMAFAETADIRQPLTEPEPSGISAVMANILSKIFGTRDGAVFAHHEKEENKKAVEEEPPTADEEEK